MDEQSRTELDLYRKKYNTLYSIGDLTATICELFGVEAPASCGAYSIAPVVDHAGKVMGEGKMEKAVLFCADALGEHQREYFPEIFRKIEKTAPFCMECVSVMPSVTPVCYGTIFTGASPAVHGIQRYEKPVLSVETLFDALIKGGKSVAIVSCNECSIDRIFRQRRIDYFSLRSDQLAFEWTMELIRRNEYDLIVCYMGDYDSTMHKTGCFSEEAKAQALLAAERFERLAEAMDEYYKAYNRTLVFVPDHGGHDVDDGHGTHGMDVAEDMLVSHCYRLREKEVQA